MRRLLIGMLASCCLAGSAAAQVADTAAACVVTLDQADLAGASADVVRLLELRTTGSAYSAVRRRTSDRTVHDVCGQPQSLRRFAAGVALADLPAAGIALLPVNLRLLHSTVYPRVGNDGGVRGGVGMSASVNAGIALRWRGVEAALSPTMFLEENGQFQIDRHPDSASYSPFIHRWHGRYIDMPQRFGTRRDARVSGGESYVRIAARRVRGGISTENMAWGPARRNPLMLSGNAQGFPHAFIESARPLGVGIGHAEFQLIWGRLAESDFFDFDSDNDSRALTGALAALSPAGLDGLQLGAAYLHSQIRNGDTPLQDVLWGAYTGIGADESGLPRDLRLLSLFMRWTTAPGGLEVYGEWLRQDQWQQWWRLLNPVDAAQAYTLGVQRIVRRGETAVRLSAEISHLSDALAHRDVGRGLQTFYVSPHLPHGHTHRGQLLGAPIGPGSESQFLGVDVFWSAGRTGFAIERVRYDDDAYYAVWSQIHGPHGHDTELSFRAAQTLALGRVFADAEIGYSLRYSRSFLGLINDNWPDFPYRKDDNITLRLTGRWTPPSLSVTW
jgi:hypothetical protein